MNEYYIFTIVCITIAACVFRLCNCIERVNKVEYERQNRIFERIINGKKNNSGI